MSKYNCGRHFNFMKKYVKEIHKNVASDNLGRAFNKTFP